MSSQPPILRDRRLYAHQMPLLEAREFEDASRRPSPRLRLRLPGCLGAAGPRGAAGGHARQHPPLRDQHHHRHWFENRRAEPQPDDSIRVTATCWSASPTRMASWPSNPCVVTDELVRTEEGLRARSRIMRPATTC
ncbi:hypothetical protein LT493_12005 [Streptomyces tricolor]|nr:hypothetical protein [Streptomyces tricolor]